MKTPLYILIFCVVAVASEFSEGDDNSAALPDVALQSPRVLTDFGPGQVVAQGRAGQPKPGPEQLGIRFSVRQICPKYPSCGTAEGRVGKIEQFRPENSKVF